MPIQQPSIVADALGIEWLRTRSKTASLPDQSTESGESHGNSNGQAQSTTTVGSVNATKPLTEQQRKDAKTHAQNLLVMSLAVCLAFTSFGCLQSLESSINSQGGLGQTCVSLIYVPSIITVTFLAPLLLRRVGVHRLIQVCQIPYIAFIAAHFNIINGVLLSMCAATGFIMMLFLTSMTFLTTTSAIDYAAIYNIPPEHMISSFSSGLYLGIMASGIPGPLISSLVLHNPQKTARNATVEAHSSECPYSTEHLVLLDKDRNILLSVLLALCVGGVLVSLRLRRASTTIIKARLASMTAWQQSMATLRLMRKFDLLLFIPIFIGNAFQKSLIALDIPSFFLTPCLGIDYVGYGLAAYSAISLVGTLFVPRVLKHVNKAVLFSLALAVQTATLLVMLLWRRSSNAVVIFAILTVWGLGDVVWNVTVIMLLGVVFPRDQEAATSNYRATQGLFISLSALFSQRIGRCMPQFRIKLAYMIGIYVLAAVNFCILDRRHRERVQRKTQRHASRRPELEFVPLQEIPESS